MDELTKVFRDAVVRHEEENIAARLKQAPGTDCSYMRSTEDARDKAAEAHVRLARLVLEGSLEREEVRTYVVGGGSSHTIFTTAPQSAVEKEAVNGMYVDLGVTLVLGKDRMRVTAQSFQVSPYVKAPEMLQSFGYLWPTAEPLVKDRVEALRAEFEALRAELAPAVERLSSKHAKKLEKSRERAARPDSVARREQEARLRARQSLSVLLGGPSCRPVLDKWSPQELLGFLKLCNDSGNILLQLESWARKLPLGSKHLDVEDIEAALDLAKVRGVMDS